MRKFLFVLLALCPLAGCSTPYVDYHRDAAPVVSTVSVGTAIPYRTGTLLTMPDRASLDAFVAIIDSAERRLWLQTYILSEKRTMAALERAHGRGVDVRVSLEPNVYGLPTINKTAFDRMAKAGISTVRIRSADFGLMHAKFLIADDRYYVSTGNMSYSTFTQNREWAFVGDDPTDLAGLVSIFRADMGTGSHRESSAGAVIVSPIDTRARIDALLDRATSSVDIAMQDLSDPAMLARVRALRERGIAVTVELGGGDRVKQNVRLARELAADGIAAVEIDRPYVHAKVVVVDERFVFVGSANFSTSGLDRNREVGLVFENPMIARGLVATIRADVGNARNLNPPEKSGTMEGNPSR